MLDLDTILRFVAAFALVIGLIGLMSYAAKRWRGFGAASGRRQGRRLEIVEALGLDAKRRVVIVRADDIEHVLLVGGESDLKLDARPAFVGEDASDAA